MHSTAVAGLALCAGEAEPLPSTVEAGLEYYTIRL